MSISLDKFTKDVESFIKTLGKFEKSVSDIEKHRIKRQEDFKDGHIDRKDLEEDVYARADCMRALKALEATLNNSSTSFERLNRKAEKDMAALVSAAKNDRMSLRHPYVLKRLSALKRADQFLGFMQTELKKTSDLVGWKLGADAQAEADLKFKKYDDGLFDVAGNAEFYRDISRIDSARRYLTGAAANLKDISK
jgi:hypothetical protein